MYMKIVSFHSEVKALHIQNIKMNLHPVKSQAERDKVKAQVSDEEGGLFENVF